jgi:tetratricopeptide (TPR) repeat protein
MARLDGIVLEGATDFSSALEKLANPGFDVAAGTPVNCFVLSDGNVTWGENDVSVLLSKFEGRSPMTCRFQCYRTGLGAENLELYEALTRKGGGIFNCYGEADVKIAAQAHRNHCLHVEKVRVVGGPSHSDMLVAGRRAAVYPAGELILAGRFNGTGRATVMVEGTFHGEKYAEEFPLEIGSTSELAPRAWAEVAVASLLALNDPKLDTLVTAYCQQFGIVGKTASFLVLENDNDYKRFNLEEERGKTLVTDLGEFLDNAWATIGRAVSSRETFLRFLDRIENRVNVRNDASVKKMLDLLRDKDFDLAESNVEGGIVLSKDVPAQYLEGVNRDRREVTTYLTESRRRADKGDVSGAVRVLSTVMEEHTGRGDALRLVGYRLLDLNQPAQAARLFERVQKQRPFEPHSYRDLARSLEESGLYAVAAINYEIVLAGTWHNRFQQDLKVVVLEEYAHMMQEAIRKKAVSKEVADLFGERLEGIGQKQKPADLRVTISWNTDATDVDLWVIEPDGTKCFYQHKATKNGGELSQDMTQGYGPERYQMISAPKGTYQVLVHYYGTNPNLLGGETHVKVAVTRNSGRANETTENHTVILKRRNEQVEVCKVKF